MNDNFDKWIEFLRPENLKGNLISCSLYIATYESFKDYVIEEIKFFYNRGFLDAEDVFSKDYNTKVLSLHKSPLTATLLWLKDNGAIDDNDLIQFEELRKYRNKLAHEMMDFIYEGITESFPQKFDALLNLRIKIEKWWILNIEIPTNSDFDSTVEIKEEDIQTSSQLLYRIILDILSGDDEKSNYYYKEFLKHRKDV